MRRVTVHQQRHTTAAGRASDNNTSRPSLLWMAHTTSQAHLHGRDRASHPPLYIHTVLRPLRVAASDLSCRLRGIATCSVQPKSVAPAGPPEFDKPPGRLTTFEDFPAQTGRTVKDSFDTTYVLRLQTCCDANPFRGHKVDLAAIARGPNGDFDLAPAGVSHRLPESPFPLCASG